VSHGILVSRMHGRVRWSCAGVLCAVLCCAVLCFSRRLSLGFCGVLFDLLLALTVYLHPGCNPETAKDADCVVRRYNS
jgi:hypothetical protein